MKKNCETCQIPAKACPTRQKGMGYIDQNCPIWEGPQQDMSAEKEFKTYSIYVGKEPIPLEDVFEKISKEIEEDLSAMKKEEDYLDKITGKKEGQTAQNGPKIRFKSSDRGKILLDAFRIINGERQDSYGSPEDSFKLIANLWNAYLTKVFQDDVLGPMDVAQMMVLFKIGRMLGQKPAIDNYIDAAGYIGIASSFLKED